MDNTYFLYAEDDPDEQDLVHEVIKELQPHLSVVCTNNGQEALDFLQSEVSAIHLPRFILLDLNMPLLNGLEALKILKTNPKTQFIPVVVYTVSGSPKDASLCEQYDAEVVQKPKTYIEMQTLLQAILKKYIEEYNSDKKAG